MPTSFLYIKRQDRATLNALLSGSKRDHAIIMRSGFIDANSENTLFDIIEWTVMKTKLLYAVLDIPDTNSLCYVPVLLSYGGGVNWIGPVWSIWIRTGRSLIVDSNELRT